MQCLSDPAPFLVDGSTVIISICLLSILNGKAQPPYRSHVPGHHESHFYFVRAVSYPVAFLRVVVLDPGQRFRFLLLNRSNAWLRAWRLLQLPAKGNRRRIAKSCEVLRMKIERCRKWRISIIRQSQKGSTESSKSTDGQTGPAHGQLRVQKDKAIGRRPFAKETIA